MKTKKRLLSILLSLVMVLGLMPGMALTAYATDYSSYLVEASRYNGDFDDAGFWDWDDDGLNGKTISQTDALAWAQYQKQQTGNATAILYDGKTEELYYVTDEGATGTVWWVDEVSDSAIKNCKIYALSKSTPDGLVPAASTHSVTITAGSNMTKTNDSGAASQTDLSGAMTAVVYTANEGYYFPTDYSVEAVNGISVTRDSYTQITVSGTPTADAAITLTAPTQKTTPDAPTTASAVNCITADNNDGKLTGVTTAMEYKKSDAESWLPGSENGEITGLVPGTYYVRLKATDTENASANQELTIEGYAAGTYDVTITAGENMTTTGNASQTGLSGAMTDVVYTANDGYYFPTDYSVAAVNGITVTRDSFTQITVSGNPTADAEITLPAPTQKTTPDAPTTAATTDCTTADNNDGKLTGVTTAMEYKKSDAENWTPGTSSDIENLGYGTYYVRYKETDTANASANQELTIKAFISATVTFKVVNGSWDEGEGDAATADKTVTLTGYEGDTLKLSADQIPAVGTKPADTYKAGSWDVTPSTETAITEATTYTYTYAQKASISQTVTFKVVNGSWDEGEGDAATADKTVTLTGYEGDTLKLSADQIPAVGTKPADTYKAGSWDVTPSTETAITEATTYTYTYAQKEAAVVTKAPKAKNLTYTGSAQELVTAGTATGGEMQYALGTATEATEQYTTSIPAKTDAGTYYVWYKVVGDGNYSDTQPTPVTVKISPVDKTALNAAIAEAETYYNSIKDKAEYAEITAMLKKAIDAAKEAAGNDNAAEGDIGKATAAVTAAFEGAKATVGAKQAIDALPEKAGAGDKAAVEAARKAYDALTDDQKKLVGEDALKKLTDAEEQVKAAEEAAKKVKISDCKITVKNNIWTGKNLKLKVTVKYKGKKLKQGTDYTLTFNKKKIKNVGAYSVVVKGKGKYTSSKKVKFNVVPKGTAFTKLTGGNKRITLKWKQPKNIKGYQLQYSLKKDFSAEKTVTIKKAKTVSRTIKGLKAGKTYYVRIRTYKTVGKQTYYSAWSKAKAVKTKGAKKNDTAGKAENFDLDLGGDELAFDLDLGDDLGDDIPGSETEGEIEIEIG